MPLYELVIIAKANQELVRTFLRSTVLSILDRGGVVRSMNNLKQRTLPYRMKAHQVYHTEGHYLTLVFDASPDLLPVIKSELKLDSTCIRATVIKLGEALDEISGLSSHYLKLSGGVGGDDNVSSFTGVSDINGNGSNDNQVDSQPSPLSSIPSISSSTTINPSSNALERAKQNDDLRSLVRPTNAFYKITTKATINLNEPN